MRKGQRFRRPTKPFDIGQQGMQRAHIADAALCADVYVRIRYDLRYGRAISTK